MKIEDYSLPRRVKRIVLTALLELSLLPAAGIYLRNCIAGEIPRVPVQGMVTMVDLGAKKCIPCKMMAPILEEMEKEYKGRAAIVFIDVWENPQVPQQYGLKAIPTQIFYDARGKEYFRHEGFLDKQSIVAILKRMGVK